MKTNSNNAWLRGSAALQALALAGAGFAAFATPAFAQEAAQGATPEDNGDVIVVTGSIIRRTDAETPSPVTTVSVENLDKRGISTVQEGLQRLAANNGPALTNSFSANGAFAAGASAVSLRGLSTNSTLVLFDGMRAAYYPLSDDGTRNFVDLNTIPDDIVDHIEVLRDGASSSYGADAIAGVNMRLTSGGIRELHWHEFAEWAYVTYGTCRITVLARSITPTHLGHHGPQHPTTDTGAAA